MVQKSFSTSFRKTQNTHFSPAATPFNIGQMDPITEEKVESKTKPIVFDWTEEVAEDSHKASEESKNPVDDKLIIVEGEGTMIITAGSTEYVIEDIPNMALKSILKKKNCSVGTQTEAVDLGVKKDMTTMKARGEDVGKTLSNLSIRQGEKLENQESSKIAETEVISIE